MKHQFAVLCLGAGIQFAACVNAANFVPLGDLPGGIFQSLGYDISANGSVITGSSIGQTGTEAFSWSANGGMVGLGNIPGASGSFSTANAVSADGSVIVGRGSSPTGTFESFRWTVAGGMVGLGDLAGGDFNGDARGVSADGNIVVGWSDSANGHEAFRWTADTQMVGLGDLPGGTGFYSQAAAASQNGDVVVGMATGVNGQEAFRWTSGEGMVGLGNLIGAFAFSSASDVSNDGSVVVGESTNSLGINAREAFRWTSSGGMTGLGDLPGGDFNSRANGVSADGTIVVGRGSSDAGTEAVVWTESGEIVRLIDLLMLQGASGLDGWELLAATAISDDKRWIVGIGTNPSGDLEAFSAQVTVVPLPASVLFFSSAFGFLSLIGLRKTQAGAEASRGA